MGKGKLDRASSNPARRRRTARRKSNKSKIVRIDNDTVIFSTEPNRPDPVHAIIAAATIATITLIAAIAPYTSLS